MMRSSNKSAFTVRIGILSDMLPQTGDRLQLGALMAMYEINNRSDILKDVTLDYARYTMPSAWDYPAQIGYNTYAQSCQRLFASNGISILTSIALPYYNPSLSTYYWPQIKSGFKYLKSSKLNIFVAVIDPGQILDLMMAANRSQLVGDGYDTSILHGVISIIYGGLLNDLSSPYYISWIQRFYSFIEFTLSSPTEISKYRDLNTSNLDFTASDYPGNFFFSDPGINLQPALDCMVGYDGVWTYARAWENMIAKNNLTGAALLDGTIKRMTTLPQITSHSQPSLFNMSFDVRGDPSSNVFLIAQAGNRSFDNIPPDFVPASDIFVSWKAPGVKAMI
eukprot:jgi/Hompol1/2173/HPOL_001431-RA